MCKGLHQFLFKSLYTHEKEYGISVRSAILRILLHKPNIYGTRSKADMLCKMILLFEEAKENLEAAMLLFQVGVGTHETWSF